MFLRAVGEWRRDAQKEEVWAFVHWLIQRIQGETVVFGGDRPVGEEV